MSMDVTRWCVIYPSGTQKAGTASSTVDEVVNDFCIRIFEIALNLLSSECQIQSGSSYSVILLLARSGEPM
jgi:hypothetical protein